MTDVRILRVYTVQRAGLLDHIKSDGWYRAEWSKIQLSERERKAYSYALQKMIKIGLCDGQHPPVWAWKSARVEAEERTLELLSQAELEECQFEILELGVPSDVILLSSYDAWCDLYFGCLETNQVEDDGSWIISEENTLTNDDTIQALLPGIHQSWIIDRTKFSADR